MKYKKFISLKLSFLIYYGKQLWYIWTLHWEVIFWHNFCYTIHTHERKTQEKEKDEEVKYY
jgi:hypothetical protein